MRPSMHNTNLTRHTCLLAQYVTAFLNAPELRGERAATVEALQRVLEATGSVLGSTQFCSVPGCHLPMCTIRGTAFCIGHHAVHYARPPPCAEFLKNLEHCKRFRDFLLVAMPDKLRLLDFSSKVLACVCVSVCVCVCVCVCMCVWPPVVRAIAL